MCFTKSHALPDVWIRFIEVSPFSWWYTSFMIRCGLDVDGFKNILGQPIVSVKYMVSLASRVVRYHRMDKIPLPTAVCSFALLFFFASFASQILQNLRFSSPAPVTRTSPLGDKAEKRTRASWASLISKVLALGDDPAVAPAPVRDPDDPDGGGYAHPARALPGKPCVLTSSLRSRAQCTPVT